MKCEIISIGDELLIGQTINTNASWIGEKMNHLGIDVVHGAVISDNSDDIISALDAASIRAELVIITGGLGPTKDDITKRTLCDYFNTTLELIPDIEQKIVKYFKERDLPILQTNLDQALLPKACKILSNTRGSASGMQFDKNNVVFISLPGVPYEMKGLMNDHVFPYLVEKIGGGRILVNKTVRTHGLGESFLAELIKPWEESLLKSGIKLAYLPSPANVKLRLTADGSDEVLLNKQLDNYIDQLHKLIPENIYGYDKDKMEQVVGDLLSQNKLTVSTAESCTGGSVAQLLTSKSGSSSYYFGSIVSYSNEAKSNLLEVSENDLKNYGAVSQQVVEQMAKGVREKLNTDYGLATSGIAGPNGGTEEKPVGTIWIAVASAEKVISKKLNLGYNRERNIHVSSISVLNLLRLELLK